MARKRRISTPYVSSVRWSHDFAGEPPWRDHSRPRTHLVSFVGSLRGQKLSIQLRSKLLAACKSAPEVCTSYVTRRFPTRWPEYVSGAERANMVRALELKRDSHFCLEPPGFSPPRKSALDSLLSGCIPVFFYSDEQFRDLWPFHFGGWGANASVRVSLQAALDGSIDVIHLLQSIPAHRVRAMQRAIATNGHKLMYGIGPYPGDAIDILLEALNRALHSPKRLRMTRAAGGAGESRHTQRGGVPSRNVQRQKALSHRASRTSHGDGRINDAAFPWFARLLRTG